MKRSARRRLLSLTNMNGPTRPHRFAVIWSVLLLAMVIPGCVASDAEPAADEESGPDARKPVPVQAIKAEPTTLRPTLDLVGVLTAVPERTAIVSARAAGWIKAIAVVEGDTVEADTEAIVFDDRPAQVALAQAEADLAEKQAALERLKNGYLPQEIDVAEQELLRSQRDVELKRRELDALAPLRQRREIPEIQYEKAKTALEAAEATLASAAAKLELIKLGTRREDIAKAEAQLMAAQAARDAAKLQLDFCRMTMPITGTVSQLTARKGMFVNQGTTLFRVVDLTELFLELRIPRKYAPLVTNGTPVSVTSFQEGDSPLIAPIARILPEADPTTGDLVAWALVSNAQEQLRPGMSCSAKLLLPEIPNTLAVPAAALADRSGTPVVTVVRDNRAYEVEVVPGRRTDDMVEIREGIQPGQWVVTEGGYGLPDGCPVAITSSKSE